MLIFNNTYCVLSSVLISRSILCVHTRWSLHDSNGPDSANVLLSRKNYIRNEFATTPEQHGHALRIIIMLLSVLEVHYFRKYRRVYVCNMCIRAVCVYCVRIARPRYYFIIFHIRPVAPAIAAIKHTNSHSFSS